MLSEINDSVIMRAENLSKRFRLGEFVSLASTLRSVKWALTNPIEFFENKKQHSLQQKRFETRQEARFLWALRNINFEVRRGERIAVLGRNGAGKSTLLKILINIMTPTEGKVFSLGHIVPLMGVGSGFNPDLTGRENVFIYGCVLGLTPAEIQLRYEEIVSFAEIQEFMDTPVKRYSKGMRARLGMAVVLNVTPDILVVDEVLAVGDIKFRAKCMEKIQEMCALGMTLLFVSHSPARVKALCDRAILLRDGAIIADGDVHTVLNRYLTEDMAEIPIQESDADEEISAFPTKHRYLARVDWDMESAPGDEIVQITMVRVTDGQGLEKQDMDIRDPIILEMTYVIFEGDRVLRPQFQIFDAKLQTVFVTVDSSEVWRTQIRQPGVYRSRAFIPGNLLGPNSFIVGASVYSHLPLMKHARTGEVVSFKVYDVCDISTAQSDYPRCLPGYFRPLLKWDTLEIPHSLETQMVSHL